MSTHEEKIKKLADYVWKNIKTVDPEKLMEPFEADVVADILKELDRRANTKKVKFGPDSRVAAVSTINIRETVQKNLTAIGMSMFIYQALKEWDVLSEEEKKDLPTTNCEEFGKAFIESLKRLKLSKNQIKKGKMVDPDSCSEEEKRKAFLSAHEVLGWKTSQELTSEERKAETKRFLDSLFCYDPASHISPGSVLDPKDKTSVPPRDTLVKYDRFRKAKYEEIEKVFKAHFPGERYQNFTIRIHDVFKNPADAQLFLENNKEDLFSGTADIIPMNEFVVIESAMAENQKNPIYSSSESFYISQIIEESKKNREVAEKLLRRRATKDKKTTPEEDKMLEAYRKRGEVTSYGDIEKRIEMLETDEGKKLGKNDQEVQFVTVKHTKVGDHVITHEEKKVAHIKGDAASQ